MRKIVFYTLGLLLLFFFYQMIMQPDVIITSPDGLQYKDKTLEEAILGPAYQDIYIVRSGNDLDIYKGISYASGKGMTYMRFKATQSTIDAELNDQLFQMAYAGSLADLKNVCKIQIMDTITNIDYEKRKTLFVNQPFVGRNYIQSNEVPDDLFTRIEDSVVIFLLLSLVPFLFLMVLDLVFYLLNVKRYSTTYYSIQIIGILLAVALFFSLLNAEAYSFSIFSHICLLVLIAFPLYFIYQYELKQLKTWSDSKRMDEFYKFALLFTAAIIVIFLANEIAILIDRFIFNSDNFTLLAAHWRRPLEMGFAFSFALGNLLNNLRRYFFELRRQNKKLKQTEGRALASEAELNAIQASVNPHFLYNSLNSIASLAKIDPDKTEAMAMALSKFYKYNTNRSGAPLSSIAEELEMLRTYLEIEKIRFGDRLNYILEADAEAESMMIPHFLLQPLIENAVKYGYNEVEDKITIRLIIKVEQSNLLIHIFDNGKPFTEELSSGYGIKSVLKKMELFYPGQHTIDFVNEPEKQVTIQIQN